MENQTHSSNIVTNPPVQHRPNTPEPESDPDSLFYLFGCGAALVLAVGIGIAVAVILLKEGLGLGAAVIGFVVGTIATLIGIAQGAAGSSTPGSNETPRVVTQSMPLHAQARAEREGTDPYSLVSEMTTPATNARHARVSVVRMPDGRTAVISSDPTAPQRSQHNPRLGGKEGPNG